MLEDIRIDKFAIMLLFMFAITPNKPRIVSVFMDDYPICKWIILFLMTIKRKDGLMYFIIFFYLYQIFYIVDSTFILNH